MEKQSKIIDVVDAQAGRFNETVITEATPNVDYDPLNELLEVQTDMGSYRRSLQEALVSQPDAGNMLRDGFRFIAFNTYSQMPMTWSQIASVTSSNKPEEYYLRDAAIGRIPKGKSGAPAHRIMSGFEGSAVIRNGYYGAIVEVTGDDILYDRIGKIRQTAQALGRSAALTEEAEVYDVLTDTNNYTSTTAAGRNDIDSNTQTWTLTQENFEKALAIIMTAKDPKSGQYIGARADTIVVGPLMEYVVKKLLTSADLTAAGTAGAVTQVGTLNVYRGVINKIIVSPYFSTSYSWALLDSSMGDMGGINFQRVQPMSVVQSTQTPDNNAWLERDVIEFKTQGRFGVGVVDDRCMFYSVSSTRPTL